RNEPGGRNPSFCQISRVERHCLQFRGFYQSNIPAFVKGQRSDAATPRSMSQHWPVKREFVCVNTSKGMSLASESTRTCTERRNFPSRARVMASRFLAFGLRQEIAKLCKEITSEVRRR